MTGLGQSTRGLDCPHNGPHRDGWQFASYRPRAKIRGSTKRPSKPMKADASPLRNCTSSPRTTGGSRYD